MLKDLDPATKAAVLEIDDDLSETTEDDEDSSATDGSKPDIISDDDEVPNTQGVSQSRSGRSIVKQNYKKVMKPAKK